MGEQSSFYFFFPCIVCFQKTPIMAVFPARTALCLLSLLLIKSHRLCALRKTPSITLDKQRGQESLKMVGTECL